ncbi:TIGR04219 family outer membrane beta-barrel protein [Shewanella intestini]|uniref:TIGR04219 family outer membrane beta-barrel protein n=1 Tax=Shewanella intestini TaxID=2017544 RepID=A0ABS5I1U0_9GAMM|nr:MULTISPECIES: TIGR04219 family outer membrane beta-barrel protein [Shewanella]MBR9727664.1 TIGR04219 family outer membrane beta-barrel protein [Shewanella intestini]MRG35186.1 TIGR04219 family outer membrane beta-barrel protein [Shewanella sp. XMDDZSB0408]
MKKSLIATALVGLFTLSSAQAATIVGFKVGGDIWKTDTSGTLIDGNVNQSFDYSSETSGSVWVSFEHPVPLLPNIKIRENRLDSQASVNFTGADKVYNNLNNTDFVLYYELLDNDLVELDIGAAYKKMNGSTRVDYKGSLVANTDIDSGVVMGYVSGYASLPFFGLYGFADLMQGIDESGVYDYSAGLGWNFENTIVDTRFRLGYREFNFDVNNFSGTTQDTKFSGAFAGVELSF